jgi:hypothetical protein
MKKGEICDEADFVRSVNEYFTEYYRPLITCMNTLRKAVSLNGRRLTKEDMGLYDRMKQIIRGAPGGLRRLSTFTSALVGQTSGFWS